MLIKLGKREKDEHIDIVYEKSITSKIWAMHKIEFKIYFKD